MCAVCVCILFFAYYFVSICNCILILWLPKLQYEKSVVLLPYTTELESAKIMSLDHIVQSHETKQWVSLRSIIAIQQQSKELIGH